MDPVNRVSGPGVCLPLDNIDTDQLIPARFMSRSRSDGYGDYLLHDMRYGDDGRPDPGFVLNRLDTPRIFEAREAIRKAVPGIAESRRLGLIIYGPGEQAACDNVDLRFTPAWDSAGPIIGEVEALWPSGATPLTEAVRQAAEVLDWRHRPGAVEAQLQPVGGAHARPACPRRREGGGGAQRQQAAFAPADCAKRRCRSILGPRRGRAPVHQRQHLLHFVADQVTA